MLSASLKCKKIKCGVIDTWMRSEILMPVDAAVVVFKCWSADKFAFHWPWFFPSVNIVHSSRLAAQEYKVFGTICNGNG